jgi:hypothetical protein
MTIAQIMRMFGDRNQVIDSERSSDRAQLLAMGLYVKELERRLDLEAGEEEPLDKGGGEALIASWRDFFGVVREMRIAQRRYFKTRGREDLMRSKTLERAVDAAVAAHEMKGEG